MVVNYEEKVRNKLMNIEQKLVDTETLIKQKGEEFKMKENKLKKNQLVKIEKLWNTFDKKVEKLYEKKRNLASDRVVQVDILNFMKMFPELQEEIYKLYVFSKTKNFHTLNWMTDSLLKKYEVDGRLAHNVYNSNKKVLVMELNGELDVLKRNSMYFNKRPSSISSFTYGNAKSLILVKPGLSANMKKQT